MPRRNNVRIVMSTTQQTIPNSSLNLLGPDTNLDRDVGDRGPNHLCICSVLVDEAATKTGDLYIRSVCFSPDGKYLATGAEDKQIRVRAFLPLSSSIWRYSCRMVSIESI